MSCQSSNKSAILLGLGYIVGVYIGSPLVTTALVVTVAVIIYRHFNKNEFKKPEVKDGWFGKTKIEACKPIPEDPTDIIEFKVNIPDTVLEDLRRRLDSARFVDPIDGTKFNYGFNGNYLKQVVDYWKTDFDWRKQELKLNKYKQYTTQIEGIRIHFLHVRPTKQAKTVVPILVTHGWPGSVWEYYKAIELLIEPKNGIAFEVICPSIPGFGFSEAPHQQGFNLMATARIFVKLMKRLNHYRFFVHGGDWGCSVSKSIAAIYPQNVRGIHTSLYGSFRIVSFIRLIAARYFPSLFFDNPKKDYKKLYPILEKLYSFLRESGYIHIQATRPDTVGAALIDSPVGLAAYILEKFSVKTNSEYLKRADGGLTEKFTLDQLLTNVMIYWTSDNLASSMRYFKENFTGNDTGLQLNNTPASVPAAVADFPCEITRVPKAFAKLMSPNLVQYSEMPRGGHFAAFEEPQLINDDIRSFVNIVLNIEQNKH